MADKKAEEKSKMDDLKKEVSMDEHMIDVKTLTARLKTDIDKVGWVEVYIAFCSNVKQI